MTNTQKCRETAKCPFKKPRFQVGDHVLVRCDEAGCPPQFEAWVCDVRVSSLSGEAYYSVTEHGKDRTTDYTDEWLILLPDPAKVDGDKARLDWLERKTPLAIWMGTFSDNDYNISLGRAGAPICTISSMDCDGNDVDEEICIGDSIRAAIDAVMNKSQ